MGIIDLDIFGGRRVIGENKRNVYIDSMEFQTKIVEGNKNPKAKVVWAGAVLAKGDVDVIELSATDIVLNTEEIRVGDRVVRGTLQGVLCEADTVCGAKCDQ
jgi:hypothetical protein